VEQDLAEAARFRGDADGVGERSEADLVTQQDVRWDHLTAVAQVRVGGVLEGPAALEQISNASDLGELVG